MVNSRAFRVSLLLVLVCALWFVFKAPTKPVEVSGADLARETNEFVKSLSRSERPPILVPQSI